MPVSFAMTIPRIQALIVGNWDRSTHGFHMNKNVTLHTRFIESLCNIVVKLI